MCQLLSAMFSSSIRLLLILGLVAVMTKGAPPECNSARQYNLPDPDSCKHYYRCNDGIATRNECPWFQYFDNVVMECQVMWAIDCNAIPPEYPPKVWKQS